MGIRHPTNRLLRVRGHCSFDDSSSKTSLVRSMIQYVNHHSLLPNVVIANLDKAELFRPILGDT